MSPLVGVLLLPLLLVVRRSSGFQSQQQQRAVRCLRQNVVSALEQQQQSVELEGGGDKEDGWLEAWKSDEYRWYILQCYTGQESWCASTIQEALLERPKLAERVAEIVVPFENVASTRGRKVFHKPRIVYPGYVFCRLRLEHDLWALLVRMPKIVNFIGNDPGVRNGLGDVRAGVRGNVEPVPLDEDEAERMLSIVRRQQDASDAIVGTFDLGDKVAVVQGNNAGERGLVRTVRNDLLVVRLLGVGAAAFDVELDPRHVRKLTDAEIDQQAQAEAAAEKRAAQAAQAAQQAASESSASRRAPREEYVEYGSGSERADAQIRSRRERKDNRRQSKDIGDVPLQRSATRPSRWESQARADQSSSNKNDKDDDDVSFLDDLFKDFEESEGETPKDDDDAFLRSLLSEDDGGELLPPQEKSKGAIFDLLEDEDLLSDLDDDMLLKDLLGDTSSSVGKKLKDTKGRQSLAEDDVLLRDLLGDDGVVADEQRQQQPVNENDDDAFFRDLLLGGNVAEKPRNDDDEEDLLLRDLFLEERSEGQSGKGNESLSPPRIDAEEDELLNELLKSSEMISTKETSDEDDDLLAALLRGSDEVGGKKERVARDEPAVDELDVLLGQKGESFLDDELFDDEMLDKLLGDDEDDLRASDFDADDKLLQMLGLFDDDDDRKRRERAPDDDDDEETVADAPPSPRTAATVSAADPPSPPREEPPQQHRSSDYSSLTVPELKAELKSRGLKVSGRKAELVARLVDEDAV